MFLDFFRCKEALYNTDLIAGSSVVVVVVVPLALRFASTSAVNVTSEVRV